MLNVKLPGLNLDNPIIPASGTFGFGYEYTRFYDLNILGSIAIKGTTLEYRYGNKLNRIVETKSGLLNAIGLQNPGVTRVINEELVKLSKVYNKQVLANVGGSRIEDYVACAKQLAKQEIVGAIELNVSCPNIASGGISFGTNQAMLSDVVKAVKAVIDKPLYVKLSPNVNNIVEMAGTAKDSGADAIVLINTLVGMRINVSDAKPILANTFGGLSGSAVFPVALRMIYEVYQAVDIPIIGVGGITSGIDVIEMMMAGASAVQVGSQNLIDPWICQKIITELPELLTDLGYEQISDIVGIAHQNI